MINPTSSRIAKLPVLLPLAFVVALPMEAADSQRESKNSAVTVLYEGPSSMRRTGRSNPDQSAPTIKSPVRWAARAPWYRAMSV